MALRKFKGSLLCNYRYDTQHDCVVSLRTGSPLHMKWSRANGHSMRRISLTSKNGVKTSYSYDDIISMLEDDPETSASASSFELHMIAPPFEYVLFSTKHQCSQYFFANTNIREALQRFARRGVVLDPTEIQILNTWTGKVSQLAVKVVETYTLVQK